MWSVIMVWSVRKPASQTVGTCLMVYTNHANFAMPMLNANMVCSVRLLARKVIFGMIGRRSVCWRARPALSHQPPSHHQQVVPLAHQPPATHPLDLAPVYRTAVACPMVTTSHVTPARDLYPVPMVIITTCPVLPLIQVNLLLYGMMSRNAVSGQAQHATSHKSAVNQHLTILQHKASVLRIHALHGHQCNEEGY